MKIKRLIAVILTAGMMMTFMPVTALAAALGWNGSDKDGWRYYTSSDLYVTGNWKQISGKWYYFNSNGYMESNCYRDGCWLTKSGAWDTNYSHGTWKQNSTGWWYEDNGWYPKSQWLWIDGSCYYFNSKGYMESSCYRDGCWLTPGGAWDTRYSHGTWKQNSTGWWYEDNGWYPKNQWLWIDGTKYWFDSKGYWNPSGPADISGTYLMKVKNPKEGDPVYYRMEIYSKGEKLGVLFSFVYDDTADYIFKVYTLEAKSVSGSVTARYECEDGNIEISCDGKNANVIYIGGQDSPLTGCYNRQDPENEEYHEKAFPEPFNDPATPNGAVDAVLAKAAREQLGLAEDKALTKSDLAKVKILDISGDKPVSLSGIEYFTGLKTLNIDRSYIKDISLLANISSLEEISIRWSFIESIPDLSKCVNLTSLDLNSCAIKDITPVTKIRSLKNLNLNDNRITSIAPIKDMKTLEHLYIYNNPITDWETIADNQKLIAALDQDYEITCSVLERARSIVKETITDDMIELEKEIAIYTKIHEIAHSHNEERPVMPDGYYILMKGWGVCGDWAQATALLMNLAGLECIEVGSDTHAWNVIRIDGKYYEIDCFWDDGYDPANWEFFNLSRARMDTYEEHQISRSFFEISPYPMAEHSMPKVQYLMISGLNN